MHSFDFHAERAPKRLFILLLKKSGCCREESDKQLPLSAQKTPHVALLRLGWGRDSIGAWSSGMWRRLRGILRGAWNYDSQARILPPIGGVNPPVENSAG